MPSATAIEPVATSRNLRSLCIDSSPDRDRAACLEPASRPFRGARTARDPNADEREHSSFSHGSGAIPPGTAPLVAHKIRIDLPQASTVLLEEKPDTIVIALMGDGRMFLNDVPVDRASMVERLAAEAQRKPQPELHLHVDRTLQFQSLATVMADAQNAGMVKVGIATDPIKGKEGG